MPSKIKPLFLLHSLDLDTVGTLFVALPDEHLALLVLLGNGEFPFGGDAGLLGLVEFFLLGLVRLRYFAHFEVAPRN